MTGFEEELFLKRSFRSFSKFFSALHFLATVILNCIYTQT